jgi:ABC-type lipoprotein export system ATPase subunit
MLLELNNISKTFAVTAIDQEMTILHDISLSIDQGESMAIVGPSGSGKSTLLNIIGALDKPTSGKVILDGRNLVDQDDSVLAGIRNREIGFIFQLHHLLPQCTLLENVLIPTIAGNKRTDDATITRAKALLQKVGLEHRMDFFPTLLSGGELQRTAVVRALINEPKLLLADEPTGSLDAEASDNLGELLMDLNREENVTLITVTHSLELARMMGNVYKLTNGGLEPA